MEPLHDARLFALVPCAGVGSRAGQPGPKQYACVQGQSVVWWTLRALAQVPRLSATLVVLASDDTQFEAAAPMFTGAAAWTARCGGASRADTVRAGLAHLLQRGAAPDDWVLVHDAARCLLRPAWVDSLIDACLDDPVGGLLALPLADTLKQADAQSRVLATVSRQGKWAAQTPQMFRIGVLARALDQGLASAREGGAAEITDEASAIEALGLSPRLVAGPAENFKLTWPADFDLAARLLKGSA